MPKKLFIILTIFIVIISLTGCSLMQNDAKKFKKEYESLNGTKRSDGNTIRTISIPKDNPIIYQTADEVVEKITNKDSFIVYFGFAECPWCRSVIETLIETAEDYNVSEIYYVDVQNIRDEKELDDDGNIKTVTKGSQGYMKLIKQLDNVLEDYTLTKDKEEISAGEKRIYAPNVVAISKGKAIQLESGISKEQTDPYQKLTAKMKKETYNSFKCLMKCLQEEETTCTKNAC